MIEVQVGANTAEVETTDAIWTAALTLLQDLVDADQVELADDGMVDVTIRSPNGGKMAALRIDPAILTTPPG